VLPLKSCTVFALKKVWAAGMFVAGQTQMCNILHLMDQRVIIRYCACIRIVHCPSRHCACMYMQHCPSRYYSRNHSDAHASQASTDDCRVGWYNSKDSEVLVTHLRADKHTNLQIRAHPARDQQTSRTQETQKRGVHHNR
jgi:hypothetical protein